MKRFLLHGLAGCMLLGALACAAEAQVVIRAPFVRVGVGGPGVYVRAPFVRIYAPSAPRVYYAPDYYGPGYYPPPAYAPRYHGSDYVPVPPSRFVPEERPFVPPAPKMIERPPALPAEKALPETPPPVGKEEGLRVEDFVKSFKPRAGSYEVDLINPVTGRPANVRFALPEGMPKTVTLRGNTLEFNYGPGRFVRIEFDKDGALVTSR